MLTTKMEAFLDFMREREEIRLRKEAGLPRPWTTDEILQEYKFTNVHREHDWTSRQLIKNFYTPHFHDDKVSVLMNAALARYFGTYEFVEAVGWQSHDDFDLDRIEEIARNRLLDGERVFTGAYVITNQGISAPKEYVVTQHFLKDLHENAAEIIDIVQMTRSWRLVAERMRQIKGFGGTGFMTKEILLDTTYTNFWTDGIVFDNEMSFPVDWHRWTPIGPGARRGLARLLGDDTAKMSFREPEMLSKILRLKAFLDQAWPKEWKQLAPTDIQFQLCEFDKYERVRLGQGRPRSKYRPRRNDG